MWGGLRRVMMGGSDGVENGLGGTFFVCFSTVGGNGMLPSNTDQKPIIRATWFFIRFFKRLKSPNSTHTEAFELIADRLHATIIIVPVPCHVSAILGRTPIVDRT